MDDDLRQTIYINVIEPDTLGTYEVVQYPIYASWSDVRAQIQVSALPFAEFKATDGRTVMIRKDSIRKIVEAVPKDDEWIEPSK